jgi:hypothetical protein
MGPRGGPLTPLGVKHSVSLKSMGMLPVTNRLAQDPNRHTLSIVEI